MEQIYNIALALIIILQIIILYKFFQLTRNVNSIRKSKFPETYDFDFDFKFLLYNNYKDEAKRFLLVRLWDEPSMNRYLSDNDPTALATLKERYEEYFHLLGEQFPDYSN